MSFDAASREVAQGPRAYVSRSTALWPIRYSSIAAIACAMDVVIIIVASVVTGTVYSLFVREDSTADLVTYAVTAIIIGAMFVPIFRDRGLYDPTALVNWASQARNIIVLWTGAFLVFAGAVFALKIGKEFSRGAVLSFGIVGMIALLGHHALWRVIIETALKNWSFRGRKSILLSMYAAAGESRIVRNITQDLAGYGFEIKHSLHIGAGHSPAEVIEQVIATARGSDVEEIFFAADLRRWDEISQLVQRLRVLPIPLTLLPDERTAALFRKPAR